MAKKGNRKKNSSHNKTQVEHKEEDPKELIPAVDESENCEQEASDHNELIKEHNISDNSNGTSLTDSNNLQKASSVDEELPKEEREEILRITEISESKNDSLPVDDTKNENIKVKEENYAKTLDSQIEASADSNNLVSTALKPEVKATKKRLTLQERLALAAKGKSKKQDPTLVTSKSLSPPSPMSPTVEKFKVEELEEKQKENEQELDKAKEKVEEKEVSELPADMRSSKEVENELRQLRLEVLALNIRNKDLNTKLNSMKNLQSSIELENKIKEFTEIVRKKDDTIDQLLQEGANLSRKELKLNENIKKLKVINNDLETTLQEYSYKNDDMAMKINELEDFLKVHNFKSIENLISSYSENSAKLKDITETLNKEKEEGWEKKYQELQKTHDSNIADREKLKKDSQELKIQLDVLKRQNNLELSQKDNLINELKQKLKSLSDEKNEEINRLESKVELLRIENESSSVGLTDVDHENSKTSKMVDYDEFIRLSESHHKLQQQHLSSQEDWKLVESSLLNKVDSLTSSLESLKKNNMKIFNELKKTEYNLQAKLEELEKANTVISKLERETKDLKFQVESRGTELKEEQERFEKFRQIYNTERDNLNLKIKNLTEIVEEAKSSQNNSNIYNIDPRNPSRTLSSNSVLEYPNNYNWSEIKFGESSTTPAFPKDTSSFLDLNHNNSQLSFTDNDEEVELDDQESQSGNNGLHITGAIPNTSMHNNIQFISKMSSNIRRLEIELNTLRDENKQLSLEKEEFQKELLKKISLDDEIEDRNKQIDELNKEIQNRLAKEQTMLELIGEKSEQVEELRADVDDLKDLCKLQVQQMMELQESKGN